MPFTDIQKVRIKIADPPVIEDLTRYGDGTAQYFVMPHVNLTTASAFVPVGVGGTAWSATGCTFDVSGQLSFSGVISANSAYKVRYVHTNFSDNEVQNFLDDGGTVLGASLEAIESLMFDAVKRARWMAADGSQYDDTAAQSHLRQMHDTISTQLENESLSGGGFGSWATGQESQ